MCLPRRCFVFWPYGALLAIVLVASTALGYHFSEGRADVLNDPVAAQASRQPDAGPYSVLIERPDGRVDSYRVLFTPQVVEVMDGVVAVSGQDAAGLFHDFKPIPLAKGDRFAGILDASGKQFKWWEDGIPPSDIPEGLPIPSGGTDGSTQPNATPGPDGSQVGE